jgi:putative transposase
MEYRFGRAGSIPHPIGWLSDNGSAYTAYETIFFARLMGLKPCTTPYYRPESNGMAKPSVKTFKRDYVYMHDLPDAITVMEQLPSWFEDYNENHPHKGLKMHSPREFRRKEIKLETCPV